MRTIPAWVDKVQDRDKLEQSIYDLCFNPDGSRLVVAAGQRVLVYDTNDGSLIQPLKGHKDAVYCVCYSKDGKRFASGSADKNVIIWTSKLEAVLKYSHNEAVQCLAFNPVSHHLVSCTLSDIALWSTDQKSLQKHKTGARVNACSWTTDGQYLALGLATGVVSIRSKTGEEKLRIERPGGAETPIWALAWSPHKEDNFDVLCVTDWGQTLSFYSLGGKMVGKERNIGFEALCTNYMNNGEYILVGGCNNTCNLLTRDGIKLGNIGDDHHSWVWCCAAHPSSSFVAIGCQDGTIAYYEVSFSTVHGLYKERYAFRENLTDVIIQHLLTDQKVRIKCRDLVKKIAIYKHRLAVQLAERVVIYELYAGEATGMHYRVKDKINNRLQCNLLVVCTNHLVLCQEKRLQCLTFGGVREREWEMDSPIRYIKVIGGPPNRECMLIGLDSGQVWKVYLDNVFPVSMLKVDSAVRCLDLSPNRQKLAVVDDTSQCLVFDIATKQLLFQEANANSVVWNSSCEDMLCFSGNGLLSIKANGFPVHQQKLMGFVVGFRGSKIFCLHSNAMTATEVPLSASMYQYLDKKLFREGYHVACLGVTDSDWKALAHAALEYLDLDIAKKAFIRVRDLKHIELIAELQEREKRGEKNREVFLGDIFAYRGKFKEAARLYQRSNNEQKALSMYTDLRMFDLAQEYLGSSETLDRKALLRKKADWAQNINEPRAAAEMYLSAGDTAKAIEIISKNGWIDMLVDVGRKTSRGEGDVLRQIAEALHSLERLELAAEVYRKLGEEESVVALHVEAKQWTEAFALADRRPEYKHLVYVPYAEWLAENDKFVEAQRAYYEAGQPESAFRVVEQLTSNAVKENRFQDAGYYYWLLAKQCLDLAGEGSREDMLSKYYEYEKFASIYYAYHTVHRYLEEPFTSYQPESLFNIARYLMQETKTVQPSGVTQFAILYALSKQARNLGAYKLARQVLDRMQNLRIPPQFQEYIDVATLLVKGKPYHDSEELLIMCYRCSTYNPLMTPLSTPPNACTNCRQPFVHSFVTFEVLPLVEFQIEEGISDAEAMRLLETPNDVESTGGWSQIVDSDVQAMRLDENLPTIADPFTARLVSYDSSSEDLIPVVVSRATLLAMDVTSVLVCRHPKPLRYRYFRNLLPELQVTVCSNCNKIFHVDDFEMKLLEKGHCPFCRSPPENHPTADSSSL